jgi:hypothetical protein
MAIIAAERSVRTDFTLSILSLLSASQSSISFFRK